MGSRVDKVLTRTRHAASQSAAQRKEEQNDKQKSTPKADTKKQESGFFSAIRGALDIGKKPQANAVRANRSDKAAQQSATHTTNTATRRAPISKRKLEKDQPELRGKLDPPSGAKPPRGVKVSEQRDGTRVVTVNIHQAVPDDHNPKDKNDLARENQRIDALRDVASYVNSMDPDIVAVQEVNDHTDKKNGVANQASILFHLLDADDMAFTPALGHDGNRANKDREYGTATYTRNGYKIEQAHNVDLANKQGQIEDRSAGVMVVAAPTGERTTVVNTHLAAGGDQSEVRSAQLKSISRIVSSIQKDGSFEYRESITEKNYRASELPDDVIVMGDLNTRRGSSADPDGRLGGAQMEHASEQRLPPTWQFWNDVKYADSIDHVYRSEDLIATHYVLSEIPNVDLDRTEGTPTDHPLVMADIERR